MKERTVSIDTADGPMPAFEAAPDAAARAPALLVFQEAFGVNSHIKNVCRRFAEQGYVALAPELYHRNGPGRTFGYDDFKKLLASGYLISNEKILMDARAAHRFLVSNPAVDTARIFGVGFCMGGFASMLSACHLKLLKAVSFYGGGMTKPRPGIPLSPILEDFKTLACPALLIFGEKDSSIPMEDVGIIRDRLESLGKSFEIEVYPGAGHGFFCEERVSYDPPSAQAAWARTLAWFRN